MYDDINIHKIMLGDETRTKAYEAAVKEIVRPGARVLDFGCGSGILSFFCSRAGAKIVFAVDKSGIIRVAKLIAKENGFDNISFIHGDADDVNLPHKVDVLISEWMGHLAVSEWMIEPLVKLRDKYLTKDGAMIPGRVMLRAAMISDEKSLGDLSFFKSKPYELDFSPIENWPYHECRAMKLTPDQLLPGTVELAQIDLRSCAGTPRCFDGTYLPRTQTETWGICGWFVAELTENVVLDTGPSAPPTHWGQFVFPLAEPFPLNPGREIKIRIEIDRGNSSDQALWRWSVTDGVRSVEMDDFVHRAWLAENRDAGKTPERLSRK